MSLLGGGVGAASGRTLDGLSRVFAAVACVVAAVVLATWAVDQSVLDLYSPGSATTKANAAVCFVALALSLVVRGLAALAALTGLVAVVATLSLVEHLVGTELGIDELLVRDDVAGLFEVPGRMAPITAVSLLLLVAARWALTAGRWRATQLLLVGPFLVGSVAQLGHLFQVEQLYGVVAYSTVAFPTALAINLLALGIACRVPGGVVWWILKDPGAGATLTRHILPVAIFLLPVAAVLPILGTYTDVFGVRFGIALMVASAALTLVAVTAVAARRLDRIDRERLAAQEGLRRVNDQLRERRDLEWRRAEQLNLDLGEERARFQRAIGKVDDLIWTVEVMSDGTLRTEFTSGDAAGLYGGEIPKEQVRAISDRVHPEDEELLKSFDDAIREGRPAEVELRIVGYDDVVRWAWVRATPRRERNQLFADGISTNVTERRQLAERRERLLTLEQEQVRQLTQLNQLRDELLAVTGHELRTPLAVVLGYAELLLEDRDLSDLQRRHLEVVVKRARQVSLLVADIFDLAKFSAGLSSIHARPLALHDAVAEAVDDHRAAAEEAQLTVETDLAEVQVEADPARLRQVLDNLLSNAVKYSLPGGRVTVRTRSADGMASIVVSDTGIGIPEAELEHVFDRVYRATTAKAAEIQGTGLGLSVAKVLVEAHGGAISVRNRPEGGTCFTVSVPLTQDDASRPDPRV